MAFYICQTQALSHHAALLHALHPAPVSLTLPDTGAVVSLTLVNLGTFAGAVCFFVAAYLLLPPVERRSP